MLKARYDAKVKNTPPLMKASSFIEERLENFVTDIYKVRRPVYEHKSDFYNTLFE